MMLIVDDDVEFEAKNYDTFKRSFRWCAIKKIKGQNNGLARRECLKSFEEMWDYVKKETIARVYRIENGGEKESNSLNGWSKIYSRQNDLTIKKRIQFPIFFAVSSILHRVRLSFCVSIKEHYVLTFTFSFLIMAIITIWIISCGFITL